MNISCAICQEIFVPSSEISSTQCGHVFHELCIERWFEQPKETCPTCRKSANMDSSSVNCIHRVYFDIAEPDEPKCMEPVTSKRKFEASEDENKLYKQKRLMEKNFKELQERLDDLHNELRQLQRYGELSGISPENNLHLDDD